MATLNTGTLIPTDPATLGNPPDTGNHVAAASFMPAVDVALNYAQGFADGFAAGTFPVPTLINIVPDPGEQPGSPGAFSVDMRTARITPISFDVQNAAGKVAISVAFGDRNEVYTALDVDGVWCWPFDVPADNAIGVGASPHVHMLPRGGWPPTVVHIKVANTKASA